MGQQLGAEVAPALPFVLLLGQHHPHHAQTRRIVGENVRNIGATRDLTPRAAPERLLLSDLTPVVRRERQIRPARQPWLGRGALVAWDRTSGSRRRCGNAAGALGARMSCSRLPRSSRPSKRTPCACARHPPSFHRLRPHNPGQTRGTTREISTTRGSVVRSCSRMRGSPARSSR